MKILHQFKQLCFFPFKLITILLLCLLLIMKTALLRPQETIENLMIQLLLKK